MVVLKFGGTSVGEPAAIRRVVGIIAAEHRRRIVVVSAFSGVTDGLLQLAAGGNPASGARALEALLDRHIAAARLVRDDSARTALEQALRAGAARVAAVLENSAGRPLSPAFRDEVVAAGELWSSRVLAALLHDQGMPVRVARRPGGAEDGRQSRGGRTGSQATRSAAARLLSPIVARGAIAVLGGFIGSDANGRTTTLGRGGSDYSAAVLGASLDAAEIQIWTDVDGVLTADPRILPAGPAGGSPVVRGGTRPGLIWREGPAPRHHHPGGAAADPGARAELAQPGRPRHARHRSRSRRAADRGAGLACRVGVALIEATVRDGSDPTELTHRVFDALAASGAEATLASVRRPAGGHDGCGEHISRRGCAQCAGGLADVKIRSSLATIVIVGEGLASDQALAAMPAQPSGHHRLSHDAPGGWPHPRLRCRSVTRAAAMGRLHDRSSEWPARGLRVVRSGAGMTVGRVRPDRTCRVALAGFGTVGQSVARLILDLKPRELELVAICNRDIARKRVDWIPSSVRWTDRIDDVLGDDVDVLVELIGGRSPAEEWIRRALEAGKSVVTANKQVIAHAGPELLEVAARSGSRVRFEAAVAGGVPVVRAIEHGLAGDRLTRVGGHPQRHVQLHPQPDGAGRRGVPECAGGSAGARVCRGRSVPGHRGVRRPGEAGHPRPRRAARACARERHPGPAHRYHRLGGFPVRAADRLHHPPDRLGGAHGRSRPSSAPRSVRRSCRSARRWRV